jgi:hypothetical protein
MAMIAPAPAQMPSTAAMTGLPQEHRLDQIAGHPGEGQKLLHVHFVSGPMISCTSPPEQKLPPLERRPPP